MRRKEAWRVALQKFFLLVYCKSRDENLIATINKTAFKEAIPAAREKNLQPLGQSQKTILLKGLLMSSWKIKLRAQFGRVALLALCLWSSSHAFAQTEPRWFVAPRIFLVHFNSSMGFKASHGAGFLLGRSLRHDWSLGFHGSWHRAEQPLVLFGRTQELQSDWLRVALALHKQWRLDKKDRGLLFVELEGGGLHLRTKELQISGGTMGTIILRAQSENKFVPAFGAGLRVRVWQRWAVLCYVKHHLLPWEERRLESAVNKRVWKSFQHLGAGLSFSF